jgi:integrase
VDAGSPPATINRETQLLGQAYTLAMRSKPPRVTTKPNIRRLSEKGNVRKEFFEPAEFAAVVDALPEYLQDVARFAYLTGWRRGDMLGLRWSAVDMERGVIRLFQGETKNDEGRTLAIAGPLAEIVARREAARLVERRDGEPVVAGTARVLPQIDRAAIAERAALGRLALVSMGLLPDRPCCFLEFAQLEIDVRIIRIHERTNLSRLWERAPGRSRPVT